jgi:choline dehydrogenase-like flavoprotein
VIEQSQRNEEIVTQERMENWQERTYNKINRGKKYHYIVVGAGSAGASAAQALASFTRGQGKFVLLIERGPSRPLSYIGGYNFYSNYIQPGVDKLNSVFGQYYIKEEGKLKSSLVERLLSCTAGMPVDASNNPIGTNILVGCNDPVVFGGGSTYNGSNTHYASDWYNERNALRGDGIVDLDALNECGEYISDVVGNREDDFFTLAQNDTVSRMFTKLQTDSCYPWIGDATGELKKEMLPSKVIKNLAFSSAETGGIRWGTQVLRMRSTGYPRRNASAALVEQFDNNYFNLDVLCNTKCNKILFEKYDSSGNSYMRGGGGTPSQYVRDASGAVVAYGINVTYNDHVDETTDTPLNILLKDTGEIFVAGNVYNSPVLLERSGIGRQTLIESCGLEFISENLEIGENLHNNYIMGGVCGGVAVAVPYGTVTEINETAYKSNKDVRRVLIDKKISTFSIAHHDDSDRSRVRGNVEISVPSNEESIIVITPGGLDAENSGAITFGTVHIDPSGSDITVPKVNFDWFSGGQDGRRNLDGAVRSIKKIYNQLTSATAAYYCLGSGFDASGNAIERDLDCSANSILYTDAVNSDGSLKSGWYKSNDGGVYNQGYAGLNLETATYDQIKTKVTTVGIREAIHWNGTVAYGKATDKNFIVKGTQNVRCCCSAVMNEPYPQNNWAMVTQWARYIAMHSLGLTAPITPTENFLTKISEYIDTSGSPVPIALDASGTEIIVTNYDSESHDLSYYIKKDAVVLPTIVAKFSGATVNTDSTATLYNFRTINSAKNGYDISVTDGLYNNYDCGITQSKLQFEIFGETSLSSKIYIYETTPAYIQTANFFGVTNTIVALSSLYIDSSNITHYTDQEYLDRYNGYPLTEEMYAQGLTLYGGVLNIQYLINQALWGYPGNIVRVELCTHRWTQAGLNWAYYAIFNDDNKGGRLNPFENKPSRINDPVYSSSYRIMTDINPSYTQQFLIDNEYITENLWYQLSYDNAEGITGKPLPSDELDMQMNHLRISLAAYDEDDKFVDDIGDVPIKPGTHRFVRPE